MEINFLLAGALKMAEAKFTTLVNGKPDQSVIDFRRHACMSCPLRTNNVCDSAHLKSLNGETISLEEANKLPHISDTFMVLRAAVKDGDVYYRGCGCELWDKNDVPNKLAHVFNTESLEIKDGTGPCPMGKWNKTDYLNYINDGNKSV